MSVIPSLEHAHNTHIQLLAFVQPAEAPSSDIRTMTKYSSQPLFPLVIFSWLGMLWGLLTEVNFFFSLRFGSLGVVGGETTNNEEHHTCIIATGPWWIAGDNVLKYIIVGWQSCPFAFIQTRKKLHVDLHIHRHASLQSALIIIHHSPVTCRSLLPARFPALILLSCILYAPLSVSMFFVLPYVMVIYLYRPTPSSLTNQISLRSKLMVAIPDRWSLQQLS